MVPFIQIALFCLSIGREPVNLKFGIVNNETIYNVSNPDASELFVNELSNKTFNKVKSSFIKMNKFYLLIIKSNSILRYI